MWGNFPRRVDSCWSDNWIKVKVLPFSPLLEKSILTSLISQNILSSGGGDICWGQLIWSGSSTAGFMDGYNKDTWGERKSMRNILAPDCGSVSPQIQGARHSLPSSSASFPIWWASKGKRITEATHSSTQQICIAHWIIIPYFWKHFIFYRSDDISSSLKEKKNTRMGKPCHSHFTDERSCLRVTCVYSAIQEQTRDVNLCFGIGASFHSQSKPVMGLK